ncbi:MAG TPA: TorF family putative porin [Thermoanaerobaculia bacterium]|nr:TorF family putative porin [Thermoanaerobaculia bacterium]
MPGASPYDSVGPCRASRAARAIGGLALSAILLGPPDVATAQESSVSVDYDLTFASAYVWRGITFTDGAVFQPSITASHGSGFSFNTWGNLDIDDVNGLSGEFQEVDLTLAYEFGSDAVTASVGLIDYLFPNGVGPETHEVFFTLGFDVPLQPSFAVYYDFDVIEGFYGTAAIEHGADFGDGWSYSVGLLAGFASDDFAAVAGGTDSGLFNGQVTLTVARELTRGSLGFFVAYSDNLDDDVLPDQEVDLFGGVSLSLSF